MAPPHPSLMFELAERRRSLRIPCRVIADLLGVAREVVNNWELGYHSPTFAYAVTYAEALDRYLVLHRGPAVFAEGLAIPRALPAIRRAAGLTQRDLAASLGLTQQAVAMFESRGCTVLASIARYASGLELRISVAQKSGSETAHKPPTRRTL